MNIYKKMYLLLFNAVTDSIECDSKEISDKILIKAQIDAENLFIENDEE